MSGVLSANDAFLAYQRLNDIQDICPDCHGTCSVDGRDCDRCEAQGMIGISATIPALDLLYESHEALRAERDALAERLAGMEAEKDAGAIRLLEQHRLAVNSHGGEPSCHDMNGRLLAIGDTYREAIEKGVGELCRREQVEEAAYETCS